MLTKSVDSTTLTQVYSSVSKTLPHSTSGHTIASRKTNKATLDMRRRGYPSKAPIMKLKTITTTQHDISAPYCSPKGIAAVYEGYMGQDKGTRRCPVRPHTGRIDTSIWSCSHITHNHYSTTIAAALRSQNETFVSLLPTSRRGVASPFCVDRARDYIYLSRPLKHKPGGLSSWYLGKRYVIRTHIQIMTNPSTYPAAGTWLL